MYYRSVFASNFIRSSSGSFRLTAETRSTRRRSGADSSPAALRSMGRQALPGPAAGAPDGGKDLYALRMAAKIYLVLLGKVYYNILTICGKEALT